MQLIYCRLHNSSTIKNFTIASCYWEEIGAMLVTIESTFVLVLLAVCVWARFVCSLLVLREALSKYPVMFEFMASQLGKLLKFFLWNMVFYWDHVYVSHLKNCVYELEICVYQKTCFSPEPMFFRWKSCCLFTQTVFFIWETQFFGEKLFTHMACYRSVFGLSSCIYMWVALCLLLNI